MKQRRVCEITGSYYVRDPRVRREAEALADAGWYVDVICLRAPNEPATSEYGNVHVLRIPLQRKRGSKLRYLFEYFALIILASLILSVKHLRRRYDLVHIHTMPDGLVFVAWLPKWTGTPIVLDIHDPMPEVYQARFSISREHWLNRALLFQERISFAFADHLIVTHKLMPQLFARSALPEKISCVMNVPDPKVFEQRPNGAQTQEGHFALLYIGTVTFTYDLDVVIHAVAELREAIPNLCLRIVGEGDDLERVQALVTSLRLGDRVEFVAPVSLDKISRMIAMADVIVAPHRNDSVMAWGFSTKLAEALFVGVPVIAARTPALTTFFDDQMVAFFEQGNAAELAAHVLRFYRNPAIGEQMVTNAQKFFAVHSWECERAHFYEVMERILCRGRFLPLIKGEDRRGLSEGFEFVFSSDGLNAEDVWARVEAAHKARKFVCLTGELVERVARQVGVERNGQFWIRLDAPAKRSEWIYRFRDILVSALALVLLSPMLFVIAVLVKLSSAGPVFYKSTGVGKAKQHFVWRKFRSMRVMDSEQDQTDRREKFRLYAQHKQTGKVIDVQRVTRLGTFLRKYCLDELPQFWNVLIGEMTLVGPRPCLPYEMDVFPEWASRRFQVRPGLTGLWQVLGRGEVALEEGLFMDVYYVHSRSFGLDVRLIVNTLRIMLSGEGDK